MTTKIRRQVFSRELMQRCFKGGMIFQVMSLPTRLLILRQLMSGSQSVSALITVLGFDFDGGQPAVSNHLRRLKLVGLVVGERQGRYVYYSLTYLGREMMQVVEVMKTIVP